MSEEHIINEGLSTEDILRNAIISGSCVLAAGLFSGLTLAFFSLDEMDLKITVASGSDIERRHAKRVLPIVRRHHHLLVTLLLCNAVVNEALPIFLDRIFSEIAAIAISVSAVLFFGEIIPQSLMAAHALVVGSILSPLVWLLMIVTSPISYPIALLLDKVVGGHQFELFKKHELREVLRMHSPKSNRTSMVPQSFTSTAGPRPIGVDESKIIFGALRLSEYTAGDAMKTFLDTTFMLAENQVLDKECINDLMVRGYSRIPVYRDNREEVVGILLVKTLLCLCFEEIKKDSPLTVGAMHLQKPLFMATETTLQQAYDLFTSAGASQLAIIQSHDKRVVGVLTFEDVLETVLQVDITDETDLKGLFPAQVAARNWQIRRATREFQEGNDVANPEDTRVGSLDGGNRRSRMDSGLRRSVVPGSISALSEGGGTSVPKGEKEHLLTGPAPKSYA
eukprot:PhF_6_TR26604/c0_g1_i1/m.38497/K16302/CNNM; metal transporter CNNM